MTSFFADEVNSDRLSDQWFQRLRNLVFPTISTTARTGDCVKIAILDSGIDLDEDFIFMNRERITCQSFLSEDQGIEDRIGHGTHTTALLLRVAPTTHVYVARITSLGSLEDTSCIERVSFTLVFGLNSADFRRQYGTLQMSGRLT